MSCSAPYYLKKLEKYVCTVKLVDETLNSKKGDEFLSVTCFGNNEDGVPKPAKMGSILRIHRGDVRKYKKIYQLNCDSGIKAAWALFDSSDSVTPIKHTGNSYTFHDSDVERLKKLRSFAKKYFETVKLDVSTLAEAKDEKKDIDLCCLILDKKIKEKKLVIRLCDGKEILKLEVDPKKYDYVSPQDFVLVRGANYEKGKLTFSEYSNLIRVPKDYPGAEAISAAVKALKPSSELKKEIELFTPAAKAAEAGLTKILDDHKVKSYSKLKDLFSTKAEAGKSTYHKIKVSAIELGPKDPHEWIYGVDKKTQKQYALKELLEEPSLKKFDLYYKFQLFVKDQSNTKDNNLYICFLCTMDGKGTEFIDVPKEHDLKDKSFFKKLKQVYMKLTRSWAVLDLMVEAVPVAGGQPVYFIVDTKVI